MELNTPSQEGIQPISPLPDRVSASVNKFRIISGVILFLGICAYVVIGYLNREEPNDVGITKGSSEYETYESSKYNFKITHPKEWEVKESLSNNLISLSPGPKGNMSIEIMPMGRKDQKNPFDAENPPCDIKTINFAGRAAIECSVVSENTDERSIRITDTDGLGWDAKNEISSSIYGGQEWEHFFTRGVLDIYLSYIQFTVTEPGTEIYRNNSYHFEITYPKGWKIEEDNLNNIFSISSPGETGGAKISIMPLGHSRYIGRFEDPETCDATEIVFADRSAKECRLGFQNGDERTIRINDISGTNWSSRNEISYTVWMSGESPWEDLDKIISTFKFIEYER